MTPRRPPLLSLDPYDRAKVELWHAASIELAIGAEQSGYRAWLERHPDGVSRLRTLARLRALLARAEVPMGEWLEAAALGEGIGPADAEAACLSSVHRAKGREWRLTIAVGLEEGLIPHHRATDPTHDDPDAALEEELRVLYVALTRARERLVLSTCQYRNRGQRRERRRPSRWLDALPPELLALAV
jgi:DNA helicase-2/ATP-dependent DNA helicase PcrA